MAKKKTASPRPQTKKPGTIPPELDTPEFAAAWSEWKRLAAERGIELSAQDSERQLALLGKLGAEKAIADIHKTMANHPLKDRTVTDDKKTKSTQAASLKAPGKE